MHCYAYFVSKIFSKFVTSLSHHSQWWIFQLGSPEVCVSCPYPFWHFVLSEKSYLVLPPLLWLRLFLPNVCGTFCCITLWGHAIFYLHNCDFYVLWCMVTFLSFTPRFLTTLFTLSSIDHVFASSLPSANSSAFLTRWAIIFSQTTAAFLFSSAGFSFNCPLIGPEIVVL